MDFELDDEWYDQLAERYDEEFCYEAGYFQELKPYNTEYNSYYDLPRNSLVIQYGGAFYPFHNGHKEILESAIHWLDNNISNNIFSRGNPVKKYVILHVDHKDYRNSKTTVDEVLLRKDFEDALVEFEKDFNYNTWKLMVIFEDNIENSCSRNFTRLYKELFDRNNRTYFLCGGDRANYALTFKDEGYCIVSGRDDHPNFHKYKNALRNDKIIFIDGNNKTSSTDVRNKSIQLFWALAI